MKTMLMCHECNKRIKSQQELLIVSFPPLTLKAPVALHMECYRRNAGESAFQAISGSNWLSPATVFQNFSFLSRYGTPTNSRKMMRRLIHYNAIFLPIVVGLLVYSAIIVPVSFLIISPLLLFWIVIVVIILVQVELCKKIEKSMIKVKPPQRNNVL